MGRIDDQEIERLKGDIAVERLAVAAGVTLHRHGKDLLGLCPFHDDREPSLVISPDKNLWHCLGACDAGGSVIDWVMKAEGISFRHAVELLRHDFGISEAPTPHPQRVKKSSTKKLSSFAAEATDATVLRRVVDHYHEALKQSPAATDYLQHRGLRHPELLETFQLGYANRTLAYRLPDKTRKAGAAIRTQLQRLGVLRESGHEHLNGSLTIPLFDTEGQVVQLYGRKVTPNLRKGTPLHLYLPGPHRGVFNASSLAAEKDIILCESLIDALTFWCAGYRSVTSAFGVNGFTNELLDAFQAHGTERVLIAYDRDAAGDSAAQKLSQRLEPHGITTFRIMFPKGMDANQYAKKVGPPHQSLGLLIRSATWMAGKKRAASAVVTPSHEPPGAPQDPEPDPNPPTEACPPSAAPTSPDDAILQLGARTWRARGMNANKSPSRLKVQLRVQTKTAFHIDQVDLYSARHRAAFIAQAAEELGLEPRVLKQDLGKVLLHLEAERERHAQEKTEKPQTPTMTEQEQEAALSLLKDPKLLGRILSDYETCGLVGEENNKLLGYLATVSRKLLSPLAVVIQSSSAAGKSSLMDAILRFVPPEERVQYSAMTGQSLFYMGEGDLCHKVLAVSEEEGATHAAYAMKLLQSEGELTIASTGKDPVTGRLQTHEYTVQGPVQLMMTTTKAVLDEELVNRCLVLSVDEGKAQTEAIFASQKKSQTLEGVLQAERRQHVMTLHQNAQRLLRPLRVVNPLVDAVEYSDTRTRARRDHMKYLTLIQSVTLLHQYQRPVKTAKQGGAALRYIESTEEDLQVAKRLMATLAVTHEMAPQTARLWSEIKALLEARAHQQGVDPEDIVFSRKEIRQHTGLSATQVQHHIRRLENLEYLVRQRDRHTQRYLYALCRERAPVSAESRPTVGPGDRQGFDNDVTHIGPAVGLNGKAQAPVLMNGSS